MSSEFKKGFPVGTFDIGDKFYRTRFKTHRFRVKRECPYCNKTGHIEFKGAIFPCPKCHGDIDYIEVEEKVVERSNENVISSKIAMIDKNKGLREIYYTDNFLGLVVIKTVIAND